MLLISQRRSCRGFTLIELLVVIGIITILGALALPAYNMAMVHARTAKCSANLRGIGAGMLNFAADNNNNLPLSGDTIPYDPTGTSPTQGWTQQLEPYLGAGSSKEDPSGHSIYQCPDRAFIANNKYYSYFNGAHAAYNANPGPGVSSFNAVNLLRMHSPSCHIIAGDITFGSFTLDDADKDDFTQDPAFGSKSLIHGGTANVVFADGHVENARTFNPLNMTTSYDGPGANYNYLYPQSSSP